MWRLFEKFVIDTQIASDFAEFRRLILFSLTTTRTRSRASGGVCSGVPELASGLVLGPSFQASSRITGIVVEQVAMDRVEIVRVAGHGVEEQVVEFSRRRRPLPAERLGHVENLWRDREKAQQRCQEPSVVVRER